MHFRNTLLATALGQAALAQAVDWPQWRGPTRDGMINEGAPWPKSIAKKKLKLSWRKEIAKGYPGPVVSENLVFTVETKSKNEIVRAFDRTSGEQKWETQWPGSMSVPFFAWKNGSWVRSTPAYDGKNLYVGGMRDFLVCLVRCLVVPNAASSSRFRLGLSFRGFLHPTAVDFFLVFQQGQTFIFQTV